MKLLTFLIIISGFTVTADEAAYIHQIESTLKNEVFEKMQTVTIHSIEMGQRSWLDFGELSGVAFALNGSFHEFQARDIFCYASLDGRKLREIHCKMKSKNPALQKRLSEHPLPLSKCQKSEPEKRLLILKNYLTAFLNKNYSGYEDLKTQSRYRIRQEYWRNHMKVEFKFSFQQTRPIDFGAMNISHHGSLFDDCPIEGSGQTPYFEIETHLTEIEFTLNQNLPTILATQN